MAPAAPNLRRRPCYANSRLLQLPQLRLQRRRWHRPRPPPGAAGTVDGITAGAARASTPVARPIMATTMVTAAAMCGDWSRRPGDPAGAWGIAATELNHPIP